MLLLIVLLDNLR